MESGGWTPITFIRQPSGQPVLSLRRRATGGNAGPRQAPPALAEAADRRGRRRDPVWSPTTVQLHAALVAHGIPAALGSVEEGYPLAITLIGVDWRRVDVQIDEFPDGDPRGRAQRRAATRDQNLAELGWAVVRIPGWRAYLEPGGVAAEILDTATGTRGGAMGPDAQEPRGWRAQRLVAAHGRVRGRARRHGQRLRRGRALRRRMRGVRGTGHAGGRHCPHAGAISLTSGQAGAYTRTGGTRRLVLAHLPRALTGRRRARLPRRSSRERSTSPCRAAPSRSGSTGCRASPIRCDVGP